MTDSHPFWSAPISRRVVAAGAGATAAAVFFPLRALAISTGPTPLQRAYTYLDQQMDLFGSGTTPRLLQSYSPTPTFSLGTASYVYDDALALLAFLKRATTDDLTRATALGDAFLLALAQDPSGTARLRSSYDASNFGQGGTVTSLNLATTTGNVAWVGIALNRLYKATLQTKYLSAAESLASWLRTNTYSSTSPGLTGGFAADNTKYAWKSTEHNIDAYAFFRGLYALTSQSVYSGMASSARRFVISMWDSTDGHFWTGNDGSNINYYPIPEDVQAWSYLAMRSPTYAGSLDWAATNLAATDGSFSGVSFSNADTSKVWFEGTAHLALALRLRNATGDSTRVATYLKSIESAQLTAPNATGFGVDAASHDGLATGEGDTYPAALHVGATAWYALARQGSNPFSP